MSTTVKLSNRNKTTREAILWSLPRKALRELARNNNIPTGHSHHDTIRNIASSGLSLAVEVKAV